MEIMTLLQGRQAPFNESSLDDSCTGDGMLGERFKNIVHLFDRMDDQAGKERIVAGDLVTLDEFRSFLNEPFDQMQLAGQGPDPHHGPYLVADRACIHIDCEASNDAGSFQSANTFRHARRRHAHEAGKLAHRQAGIRIERGKNAGVGRVQHRSSSLKVLRYFCLRHGE